MQALDFAGHMMTSGLQLVGMAGILAMIIPDDHQGTPVMRSITSAIMLAGLLATGIGISTAMGAIIATVIMDLARAALGGLA